MTQKLVFKNYQLESLYDILFKLKLKGSESRLRTRFNNLIATHLQLVANEHESILLEYAKKDVNGEVVRETNEQGQTFVIMDNRSQYVTEVNELENEEFVIEVNVENVNMIKSVTTSLLDADIELTGNEAIIYDSFCLIFENIDFEAIK